MRRPGRPPPDPAGPRGQVPAQQTARRVRPHPLPDLPPATLGHLADGAWITAGEPVVLLGDSGTGKTHLLIALGTAAAEAGRRVRYITCAHWSTSSPKPLTTNNSPASWAATPASTCSA